METVGNLSEKVEQLIELVKQLREKSAALEHENGQLLALVDEMKSATHHHTRDISRLREEKDATKQLVTELIQAIDGIIQMSEQKS